MEKKERQVSKDKTAVESGSGTVVGTRFSAEQREVIEKAAALLNCSAAKVIREASVARAADVVNGSGRSKALLQELANGVVRQLVNPELEEVVGNGTGEEVVVRTAWSDLDSDDRRAVEYFRHQEGKSVSAVRPAKASSRELEQIKNALETCGTVFLRMMVEAWESGEASVTEYVPQVKASDLLKGGVEEVEETPVSGGGEATVELVGLVGLAQEVWRELGGTWTAPKGEYGFRLDHRRFSKSMGVTFLQTKTGDLGEFRYLCCVRIKSMATWKTVYAEVQEAFVLKKDGKGVVCAYPKTGHREVIKRFLELSLEHWTV